MQYSITNLASAQLHSSDCIANSQECSLRCCVAGSHSLRSWLLVSGHSTNLVYFSVAVSHTIDASSTIGLSFLTKPLTPLRLLAMTLAPSVPRPTIFVRKSHISVQCHVGPDKWLSLYHCVLSHTQGNMCS